MFQCARKLLAILLIPRQAHAYNSTRVLYSVLEYKNVLGSFSMNIVIVMIVRWSCHSWADAVSIQTPDAVPKHSYTLIIITSAGMHCNFFRLFGKEMTSLFRTDEEVHDGSVFFLD